MNTIQNCGLDPFMTPSRRQTTLPLKWICQRLEMGLWKSINRRLYEDRHLKC